MSRSREREGGHAEKGRAPEKHREGGKAKMYFVLGGKITKD